MRISLIPSDTTLKRVGALSNADGSFLLVAAPGLYTLQGARDVVHAQAGRGRAGRVRRMREMVVTLTPQGDRTEGETIVEARLRQNTENALLAARRKNTVVGDAVSAEQVRRSPDKERGGSAAPCDRAFGVRRQSTCSCAGLGERYSSTRSGRRAPRESRQNRRVVPLDLLPANLLDNIVVQKTYTADRPGEFGGGDVQVRTRDFPGARVVGHDVAGLGAGRDVPRPAHVRRDARRRVRVRRRRARAAGRDPRRDRRPPPDREQQPGARLPQVGRRAARGRVPQRGSPTTESARPNSSYALTYGDEFKLFGRSLGLIESWSLDDVRRAGESQRFFMDRSDTLYDYAVRRSTESVQLGGITA